MTSARTEEAWARQLADLTGLSWGVSGHGSTGCTLRSELFQTSEDGLSFVASLARWHAGDATARWSGGGHLTIPVQTGERGWRCGVAVAAAPAIVAGAARWAGHVAALLESDLSAAVLERLLDRDCAYDRGRCPPGWTAAPHGDDGNLSEVRLGGSWESHPPDDLEHLETEVEVREPVRGQLNTCTIYHPWRGDPESVRVALWQRHERLSDPPGYAFEPVAKLDRGRRLWSWRWAGRDVTASTCPKPRDVARADAWHDFWHEGRSAGHLG